MVKVVIALVLAMAAAACASLISYRYADGVSARHFYKGEGHYGIASGIYGLGYGGFYGAYDYAPYFYDGYYGYDGLGYGYGPYGYYGRYFGVPGYYGGYF
ncbi:hypothetical protein HNY73_002574 [Argiope bruennichi]|uniref:Uncharacterized protein n=1 Tax=Argiope bruennichi TaxID=94029 RepID=A0A8T0FV12_ARGBR|nr:hypothetical protein HNY73_002574 [Argiope bruennichi]